MDDSVWSQGQFRFREKVDGPECYSASSTSAPLGFMTWIKSFGKHSLATHLFKHFSLSVLVILHSWVSNQPSAFTAPFFYTTVHLTMSPNTSSNISKDKPQKSLNYGREINRLINFNDEVGSSLNSSTPWSGVGTFWAIARQPFCQKWHQSFGLLDLLRSSAT